MSDGDTDSLSPMTRTIGAMQENPAPPPTILGTSGSLVYGDMPPAQRLGDGLALGVILLAITGTKSCRTF